MLYLVDCQLASKIAPTSEELPAMILTAFGHDCCELFSCCELGDRVVVEFFKDFES